MTYVVTIFSCAKELHKIVIKRWRIATCYISSPMKARTRGSHAGDSVALAWCRVLTAQPRVGRSLQRGAPARVTPAHSPVLRVTQPPRSNVGIHTASRPGGRGRRHDGATAAADGRHGPRFETTLGIVGARLGAGAHGATAAIRVRRCATASARSPQSASTPVPTYTGPGAPAAVRQMRHGAPGRPVPLRLRGMPRCARRARMHTRVHSRTGRTRCAPLAALGLRSRTVHHATTWRHGRRDSDSACAHASGAAY